ncbi:MAG: hypothetical protein UU07_C0002G0001 [Parcubacteria group bacterium GW2011_GWF1_40_5]|nr:MAG: hypothetical protein UU07_C0002G0001 [Parcubacteria group bacterium GW2011_GWF1_40_5]
MQFKAIILLSIFCCLQGFAALKELETRKAVLESLPPDLSSLSNNSKVLDLKKKFKSKIIKESKTALFLKYFSESNDVTIGTQKQKLTYVYLKANQTLKDKHSQLFSRVYSELTSKEKDKINEDLSSASHDTGRFIKIDLPEQGLMLEFSNNEAKSLHSVTFWTPGEKHP